jgi:hypothetical protein
MRSGPRRRTATAERTLLSAVRAYLDAETARDPPVDGAALLAWPQLLERAEDERVAPLLYALSRTLDVPAPVAARLRSAWVAFGRQHLLGVAALHALLDAFEGASIPVIPLKGPALGEALYAEPGLRPFTDLDLLVRRADVPRAVELLVTLGYRPLEYERPLAYDLAYATAACFVPTEPQPDRFPIDLHWNLVSFVAGNTPATLDAEEVWVRAVADARWGRRVLVLDREDLLLYLALHLAVHHPLEGLAWQLDLALLLRRQDRIDWDAVVARASRWRLRSAIYFALKRVEDRFAAGVPSVALSRLRPRGLRGAWLDRLGRLDEPSAWLDHLIAVLLMDRPTDLIRALAAGALPGPVWVRLRYPSASTARSYAIHYRRLAAVGVRTGRAILGRRLRPDSLTTGRRSP